MLSGNVNSGDRCCPFSKFSVQRNILLVVSPLQIRFKLLYENQRRMKKISFSYLAKTKKARHYGNSPNQLYVKQFFLFFLFIFLFIFT